MELSFLAYLLMFFVGIVTGIINTLAGSGSFITLPVMIFLGLDATTANATNRVGVITQSAVGAYSIKKFGNLNLRGVGWYMWPSMIGGIVGTLLAVIIDDKAMEIFIGVLMVIMLIIILLNPKKWFREISEINDKHKSPLMLFIFFLIGIYGGFLQAGVGIFILTSLVMLGNYSFNHANAVKLIIVTAVTLVALIIFQFNGKIDWFVGLTLAAGQSVGAVLAAKYATSIPGATIWMRRMLIFILIIVILRYFSIFRLVYDLVQQNT